MQASLVCVIEYRNPVSASFCCMKYKIIHIICSFKRQNVQSLFEFLESIACRGSETAFTPLLLSATEHTPTFFFYFLQTRIKTKGISSLSSSDGVGGCSFTSVSWATRWRGSDAACFLLCSWIKQRLLAQSETANVILFGYEICGETDEMTISWEEAEQRSGSDREEPLWLKALFLLFFFFRLLPPSWCFRKHLPSAWLLQPPPPQLPWL